MNIVFIMDVPVPVQQLAEQLQDHGLRQPLLAYLLSRPDVLVQGLAAHELGHNVDPGNFIGVLGFLRDIAIVFDDVRVVEHL